MLDLERSLAESRGLVTVTADTVTPGPANTVLGMVKTASDLARYRHLIDTVRPDGIVEIGTLWGTSALWFASAGDCPVFTVDICPQVGDETRSRAHRAGVTFWTGRSTDPGTLTALHRWAAGVINPLVVLDGDHAAATVTDELDLYTPLVAAGGYVVVEDGIIRWAPGADLLYRGNPLDAIEAWLPAHPDFEADTDLEDMYPTTQAPSGWLRRRQMP